MEGCTPQQQCGPAGRRQDIYVSWCKHQTPARCKHNIKWTLHNYILSKSPQKTSDVCYIYTYLLTWNKSTMWAPASSKQLKHTLSLVPCHVFGTMFILPCVFCPRKGWHEEVKNKPGSFWITFEYFKHYSSHFKCMSQEWNGEKMFVLFFSHLNPPCLAVLASRIIICNLCWTQLFCQEEQYRLSVGSSW